MKTFISHAHQDKWFADQIVTLLDQLGVKSWYDTVELFIGDNLLQKIHEGLADCSHLIVILSNHSINSKWVKEELGSFYTEYVSGKKMKVYPFLLEDIGEQMPLFLRKYLYADFRGSTSTQLNPAGVAAVEKELRGVPVYTGAIFKCYRTSEDHRLLVTLPEGKTKAEINHMAHSELVALRSKLAGQSVLFSGRITYTLAMMLGAFLGNSCKSISAFDPKVPNDFTPILLS